MKRMQLVLGSVFAAIVLVSGAASVLAGGYSILVETTSAGASSPNVLVVRSVGCLNPENADVTAEAVGLNQGKRETIALKLNPVSPGVYHIARQWPDGRWVVIITGQHIGLTVSALVKLTDTGTIPTIVQPSSGASPVTVIRHKPSTAEIDAALKGSAAAEHAAICRPVSAGVGALGLFAVGAAIRRKARA